MHKKVIVNEGDYAEYFSSTAEGPYTHIVLQKWTIRSRRMPQDETVDWVEMPEQSPTTFRLGRGRGAMEVVNRTLRRPQY